MEEKGGSIAVDEQGLGFVAHKYTWDQGAALKFCVPDKESQLCCAVDNITVIRVRKVLLKACLRALGWRKDAASILESSTLE